MTRQSNADAVGRPDPKASITAKSSPPLCRTRNPSSLSILLIVFCALSYSIDVAYCEDLAPSHFAQAILGDTAEVDLFEAKTVLPPADAHYEHSVVDWAVINDTLVWYTLQTHVVVPDEYLHLPFLISRPPPSDLPPLNRSTLYVRVGSKGGRHATSSSHRRTDPRQAA